MGIKTGIYKGYWYLAATLKNLPTTWGLRLKIIMAQFAVPHL